MCTEVIVGTCVLALVLSFLLIIALRYVAGFVVWFVLFSVVFTTAAGATFFWAMTAQSDAFTPVAILFSVFAIVILLVILFLRKRIQLVIQLFKEASKSLAAMPVLFLEPLLSFTFLVLVFFTYVYFSLLIESSGILVESNMSENLHYETNVVMRFTRWYNIFIMLWMVQFIIGCQHMLVGGAVSTWYFSRNKNALKSPVFNSANNLIRFHLGSVSVSAILVALVQIAIVALRTIRVTLRHRVLRLVDFCLCGVLTVFTQYLLYLEQILKFLGRNALIFTAMHGCEFFDSSSRVLKLLANNALCAIAINSVGDFVLALSKLLVTLLSVLAGYGLIHDKLLTEIWAPLLVIGILAYFIAHCFLTLYEVAVDTIFICFCEDCEENDGTTRPYYMSCDMAEFIQKSTVIYNQKKQNPQAVEQPQVRTEGIEFIE